AGSVIDPPAVGIRIRRQGQLWPEVGLNRFDGSKRHGAVRQHDLAGTRAARAAVKQIRSLLAPVLEEDLSKLDGSDPVAEPRGGAEEHVVEPVAVDVPGGAR